MIQPLQGSNLGEVINGSIAQWTTEAWVWNNAPEFGAVVCADSDQRLIFGVVNSVQTGAGDDLVRQVFAYQKSQAELRRDQPQIFELLKTRFCALPVAYYAGDKYVYALPPQPPIIHSFVRFASIAELSTIFKDEQAFYALFSQSSRVDNFEELLLALIRNLQIYGLVNKKMLLQLAEQLSLVLANDYRRLQIFMRRLETASLI